MFKRHKIMLQVLKETEKTIKTLKIPFQKLNLDTLSDPLQHRLAMTTFTYNSPDHIRNITYQ